MLALVPRSGYFDLMTLNEGITRCRVTAALSRSEVARRLGITLRQWWRMETGRIRILAIEMPKIAWALETTVSDLYGSTVAAATAPGTIGEAPVLTNRRRAARRRGEKRDLAEELAELRAAVRRLAPAVLELADTEMRRRT